MDPVIVVGAGPVGLALALALARQEVPSIVLDEGSGLCAEGPRSVVLGRDGTALLARLGYTRAASDAARWDSFTIWRRRQEVLRVDLAGTPALHLPQHRLQRGLRDALTATLSSGSPRSAGWSNSNRTATASASAPATRRTAPRPGGAAATWSAATAPARPSASC